MAGNLPDCINYFGDQDVTGIGVRLSYYILSFQVLLFYILGDFALGTSAVAQLGILTIVLHIIDLIYIFKGLLDQYILSVTIMQALLTTGPQIIHVLKFKPDRYQRMFYLFNLLFTSIEIGVALSRGGDRFVDRNKDLCMTLRDAIITTEGGRTKCILPFYSLCVGLVGFDVAIALVDTIRNKGVNEYKNRQYIRPRWLTWKVTHSWNWTRAGCCLSGTTIWTLSVVVLEFFIIRNFHVYNGEQLSGQGYYTLENNWSYGQSIPVGAAAAGILFSFRGWLIQPGRPVKGKTDKRYGEGWFHRAARNWLNNYAKGRSVLKRWIIRMGYWMYQGLTPRAPSGTNLTKTAAKKGQAGQGRKGEINMLEKVSTSAQV